MHISAAVLLLGDIAAASISIGLRRSEPPPVASFLKRDTLTLEAPYNASGGGYYAEIEVGSPGQKVKLHVDTGSSDTWVNNVGTDLCDNGTYVGCDEFFNPNKSTTMKITDRGGFNISYLDGRTSLGHYFTDTVSIGGKSIKNQTLGLAENETPGAGVLGLGLSAGVAASEKYPTVVDTLASDGKIERAAFSVYLNHSDADQGAILFGGIDTEKYFGELATLSLVPGNKPGSGTPAYAVRMSGLAIQTADGAREEVKDDGNDVNVTTILDTGSTLTYLPNEQAEAIWKAFDVQVIQNRSLIECNSAQLNSKNASVHIQFPGKTIEVPLRELAVKLPESETALLKLVTPDMDEPCVFGIQGMAYNEFGPANFGIIGDTVLRSAYVVFDAENKQIGIAQANVGAQKSKIVDLKAGKDFPKASGVEDEDNGQEDGGTTTVAPSGSQSPTPTGDGESAAVGSLRWSPLSLALAISVGVVASL